MSTVIEPRHTQVYYDIEDSYGDGGSIGSPTFAWIGIVQEAISFASKSKMGCRGLGSVDINSIRTGMRKPELTLKWVVQRERTVAVAFDPHVLLDYANVFPTYGLGLEVLYTYGATPSYVSLWYKGMAFDSLMLDWSVDSFVTASAKFVGKSVTTGVAGVGASYAANPLNLTNSYALPLTGYDTEVFLDVDAGGDTTQANIQKVHLEIRNKLKRVPVIQVTTPELIKYLVKGQRDLKGELTIYFENRTAFDYIIGNNALDIVFHLHKTDNAPNFDFTGCKLDNSVINTRITEFPCTVNLPFTATALTIT